MRVHGPDWERVSFFITSIGFRRKLDDSVQRNLDIWEVGLRQIMEICVQTTQDGLAFSRY